MKSLKKLSNYLKLTAPGCIHPPAERLSFPFVTPTAGIVAGSDDEHGVPQRSAVGHYLQMYDWDACFFSQVSHHVDRSSLPVAVVGNFLKLMEPDGYVPRTVSPRRVWDAGDHAKPFLCQTLLAHVELGQTDFLNTILLESLSLYLSYFDRHRRHESGLYHWRNVLESGVDNNLALLAPIEAARDENEDVGKYPDGRILAVDINTYLVREFESFARLAEILGKDDLKKEYHQKASHLKELIERKLWDDGMALYTNLDPVTGEKVRIKSWTGLTPICFGIARKARAHRAIAENILHEEEFLRPAGLASVAASERLYNQAPRGLYGRAMVSNWQGPVWVLVSALACRGLISYGYEDGAVEVAKRITQTLVRDLNENDCLHENYHAETGAPLWAPQFMSWNLLTLEMIDLLQ